MKTILTIILSSLLIGCTVQQNTSAEDIDPLRMTAKNYWWTIDRYENSEAVCFLYAWSQKGWLSCLAKFNSWLK